MGNSHKKEKRCVMFGLKDSGKTTILYRLVLGEVVTTIPTVGFNKETINYKKFNMTITECGGQQPREGWKYYYSRHNNYYPIDAIIWVLDATTIKLAGFGNKISTKLIVSGYTKSINKDFPMAIIDMFVDYCFVEDKNEIDQMEILHSIIKDEELKDAKLLIFANKYDLLSNDYNLDKDVNNVMMATKERIVNILMLNDITNVPWKIQFCSAIVRRSPIGFGLYKGLDWIIDD